jgi:hypothetical protein
MLLAMLYFLIYETWTNCYSLNCSIFAFSTDTAGYCGTGSGCHFVFMLKSRLIIIFVVANSNQAITGLVTGILCAYDEVVCHYCQLLLSSLLMWA